MKLEGSAFELHSFSEISAGLQPGCLSGGER
jgi:hypothetical protein